MAIATMVAHKNLPVSIRTAQSQDAEALAQLYLELTQDPKVRVLPEHLATLAADPRCRVLVAAVEGEVLGTVLSNFCADPMYAGAPAHA